MNNQTNKQEAKGNFKMTYYAVRRGRKVGIYTSWEECKEQVNNYTDASYKKFDNKQDAYRFLVGYKNKTSYKNDANRSCLYIKGLYDDENKAYKCEVTLIENSNTHKIEQYGFEHLDLKEDAGIILGIFEGVGLAAKIGVPVVDVVCVTDIESLPDKHDYVIKCKSYLNRMKSKIKVTFYKETEWK